MSWPPIDTKPGAVNRLRPGEDLKSGVARLQREADKARGVKTRQKRSHGEDDLQIAIVELLSAIVIPPARFWAVPNGYGQVTAQQGARFRKMGLTAGVSDLHFAWKLLGRGALFGVIELKHGKNTATAEQLAFLKDMNSLGHYHALCWSLDEVVQTLKDWRYPMGGVTI